MNNNYVLYCDIKYAKIGTFESERFFFNTLEDVKKYVNDIKSGKNKAEIDIKIQRLCKLEPISTDELIAEG